MTQPKVKEYIEARVKDTGDTMTGPLVINNLNTNASLTLFSQEDIGVVQAYNNNNWSQRRSLIIKDIECAPTLNNVLTLGILDDGTWKEYNILHTGNKELIQALTYGTDREGIPNNADLNNYLTVGSYRCSSNATASTLINSPTETAFIMDIVSATGTEEHINTSAWTYIIQKIYTCMYNKIYIRSINSDPSSNAIRYGDWVQILNSGNYSNYALPLSGGTLTGKLSVKPTSNWYQYTFYSSSGYQRAVEGDDKRLRLDARDTIYVSDRRFIDLFTKTGRSNINEALQLVESTGGIEVPYNILHSGNYASYALPLSGGTMNGILYTNGLRMKTTTIRVNGDLNTYYPVCIDTGMPNTEGITIYVSKGLNTVSPAWTGNHPSGTSSCMAGYYLRNNGWDGNGEFCYNISPAYQNYAKIIGHVELMRGPAHHLVLWLRGGGADYTLAGSIPLKIQIGYEELNLGNDTFPSKVFPMTSTNNLGWYNLEPPFLSIKGGTIDGNIVANAIYGAVWNDYAEYRSSDTLQPGRTVIETGEGDLILATERLQPGANIISDTFGFAIGETDKCQTPIAVSGRVLAYPYEDREEYAAGDPVCSGPNGTVSKMTREEVREYPERIIGTVSEIPKYEVWGTGNIQVNGRIWIKV